MPTRLEAARSMYLMGLENVATLPEPVGQKFPNGSRVKIADDLGMSMSHFRSGNVATVEYTYAHAYGGNDIESYSLKFDDGTSSAWYKECQLTLV